MQKVYLLLRNNQQQGPYTLDELLALGVKPSDLIWVEGKSAAWRYPSEIQELGAADPRTSLNQMRPATKENTAADLSGKREIISIGNKKVFVSLPFQPRQPETTLSPEDQLEQKAEALRQRLQSYTPPAEQRLASQEARPYRSLYEVTNDTQRQRHFKPKKNALGKKQSLAILVVVLITVPLYFVFSSKPTAKPVATPVAAEEPAVLPQKEVVENVATQNAATNTPDKDIEKPVITKKATPKPPLRQPVAAPTITSQEAHDWTAQTETTNDTNAAPEPATTEKAIVETATAKKKTVGEAIDGFFSKFKSKKKETAETSGTQSSKEPVRRASKRNEEVAATPPPAEQLARQVHVTAQEPAENWMMGIKGLKLTLQNESDYKLTQAAVEVSYYDEQNILLESKTVLFKNVPPHQKVTMAAPDHRLASYAKHQLLSVSGE